MPREFNVGDLVVITGHGDESDEWRERWWGRIGRVHRIPGWGPKGELDIEFESVGPSCWEKVNAWSTSYLQHVRDDEVADTPLDPTP